MQSFYHQYQKNYIYSQFGEEGLLDEILGRLQLEIGTIFEAGAHNGSYCSNSARLIEKGWMGKLVEGSFDLWQQCCEKWKNNEWVSSQCSMLSPANVNAFVPSDCNVLSLDTDGEDYGIWEALEAKPAVVIIEIDSSIQPHLNKFNVEGGASYLAMLLLGIEKGYFLVCHTGNMVFVDNQYRELFPEIEGDGLENLDLYFNRSWLGEKIANPA